MKENFLEIKLDDADRSFEVTKTSSGELKVPIYCTGDSIKGRVIVNMKYDSKPVNHKGIFVMLYGVLVRLLDNVSGSPFVNEFINLAVAGTVTKSVELPFSFDNISFKHDSYNGKVYNVIYYLYTSMTKSVLDKSTKIPIVIRNYSVYKPLDKPFTLEVGLRNAIGLEILLDKKFYHLEDVVIGRVTFNNVNIYVVKMEVTIERCEILTYEPGLPITESTEEVFTFEIMDGTPPKGESIPFRIFLKNIKLSPTLEDVSDRVSVRYFMHFGVFDISMRKYFKREEVFFWREAPYGKYLSLDQLKEGAPLGT